MGFFDDFKWFRPYGDNKEAYTKGISLIGGLIKFESTFSNEIILGLKNENFLGAAFEGLIGHDIDLSLALKVVFEKADGKLKSDDLDFLTPESNKISKEIVNKIDELLKEVFENQHIVDREVLINKLNSVLVSKYNEFVKNKFEEIKKEQIFVDSFYQEVKNKIVKNDTNLTKINNKKETIINKKSEFSSIISTVNNVKNKSLNITSKIESVINEIDKEINKKFSDFEKKKQQNIDKINNRINELKKQKKQIDKIKKVFSNKCEDILKEEIEEIDNKISPDINELKKLSSVLSMFSEDKEEDIKEQKIHLMEINNEFIEKTKTYSLKEYEKSILEIYNTFYAKSKLNLLKRYLHTTEISISKSNLKHSQKAEHKAQVNLIYYMTLIAEKMDEIEKILNTKLKKLMEEEKYEDFVFQNVPPWKFDKKMSWKHSVNVITGFNYAAGNSPVIWKNASDIVNFKKTFKKIKYGDIYPVLSKVYEVIYKIRKIREYLIDICSLSSSIDQKIDTYKNVLKKLDQARNINTRIFISDTLIVTVEKFDIELKNFITGV